MWKEQSRHFEFINYDKIDEYRDFGGIRIEDDILVTKNGYENLSIGIAKTIKEIESISCSG